MLRWVPFISYSHLRFRSGKHSVQWMTLISFFSVTIITAATILIQSVMNGLTSLVIQLYQSMEPDIRIVNNEKKYFYRKEFPDAVLQKPFVSASAPVYEKKALIKTDRQSYYITVCCIGREYLKVVPLDTLIKEGTADFSGKFLFIGKGLGDVLGASAASSFNNISLLAPEKNISDELIQNESSLYRQVYPPLLGYFSLNDELDFSKIFISEHYVQELFSDSGMCSSIDLKVSGNPDRVALKLKTELGEKWKVIPRSQTNLLLIKTLRSEKEITFYVLIFILAIALITVIGSITMLIIEKKKDIFILYTMGARIPDIKKIFILDGVGITFLGGLTGMALGLLTAWFQETYHFVPFGEHFIISYYPVQIQTSDVIKTLSGIVFMSILAGIYPSHYFISEDLLKFSSNKV